MPLCDCPPVRVPLLIGDEPGRRQVGDAAAAVVAVVVAIEESNGVVAAD